MISYCITVYKEKDYIQNLLDKIYSCKTQDEEIVVVQTYKDIAEKSEEFFLEIQKIINSYTDILYHTYHFENNFADLKNYLNSFANKNYIFNLDADEDYPTEGFPIIRDLIQKNPSYDLLHLPRINTVSGLTAEDIKQWNWKVDEKGWINWPDYQPRLFKNLPHIKWQGGVHEQILGYSNMGIISPTSGVAIIHNKDIQRQREQNKLYDNIVADKKAPISISSCRSLIGLCSWNNPDLLKYCVDSLLFSINTSIDRIAVVLNQGDKKSIEYLYDRNIPFIFNPENSGPLAIDFLKGYIERSEYFLNSNDDMIFHPGFMDDLVNIVQTHYPATSSCGLVENFDSGNPAVVVDNKLKELNVDTAKLFLSKQREGEYKRQFKTYGYNHPILCKSQDLLDVGGYSGNWDMNFLSGYGRDDMFPYVLWKKSDEKYKFIVSDQSIVFHLSSYTNKKLPFDYRKQNHNQDKFATLTGMSLNDFRNNVIRIGTPIKL